MQASPVSEMDPITLYRVLQLRTDVFVVEQHCPYPELDGRDIEPDSLMVWAEAETEDGSQVVATLRILRDRGIDGAEDTTRIGRVTAHRAHRGSGLARALFQFTLERCAELVPGLAIVLDAQEPLEGWYASFGFTRTGPTFLDDDIAHVPMRREPDA